MSARYSRRTVITALPALVSGFAGCSVLSNESRAIGIFIVNQTDDYLTAEIQVSQDGDVLVEQRVELAENPPDADHASVFTQASVGSISQGTTLAAEILVSDNRAESVDFTTDCEVDGRFTGDEVSFFIRNDLIETQTGRCTTEELPF